MDWSNVPIPAMRLEQRFGDRVVPAFCERPANIWVMLARGASKNSDAEALACGDQRMNWCEVITTSQRIAGGFRKLGLKPGDRVAILLGNRIAFPLILFAAAHQGLITVLLVTRQQKPDST